MSLVLTVDVLADAETQMFWPLRAAEKLGSRLSFVRDSGLSTRRLET